MAIIPRGPHRVPEYDHPFNLADPPPLNTSPTQPANYVINPDGSTTVRWGGGGGGGAPIGGAAAAGGVAAAGAGGPTAGGATVAGAGGATTGGTMAATGGSWWSNPNLWGAVLGAGGSYLDAEAAKKAGRNAGRVDISSSRNPWDPGEEFILDALGRGRNLMDRGRPGSGGGRGRGSGGGGVGGGGVPQQYRSAANADSLAARAERGHPLYGASNNYVAGTLGGDGADANAYRSRAGDMFGNMNNENLDSLLEMLTGRGAGRGGFGGGVGGGRGVAGGRSAAGASAGPVGAAEFIKDILGEKYLTESPHSQAVIEAANRRVMDDFSSKVIPGVNTKYAGAGALGSEAWNEALRRSTGAVTDSLADNASSVLYRDYNDRMGDLMDALGLGTQLDMHAADDATRRAGIASSAGSAADANATRMEIARLGALSDAVGSSVDLTKTGALGMAGLADMMSGDQRYALSMVPDLTGMDIRDLESAFGANFGIDQLGLEDRKLDSANRNAGADRSWRRHVYENEAPWNDLLRYGDLVGSLTGPYGDSREMGLDARNVSPYTGSPLGQGVAGGLAGWAMGDEYSRRRRGGGEG